MMRNSKAQHNSKSLRPLLAGGSFHCRDVARRVAVMTLAPSLWSLAVRAKEDGVRLGQR
jgi:hypothetical protein